MANGTTVGILLTSVPPTFWNLSTGKEPFEADRKVVERFRCLAASFLPFEVHRARAHSLPMVAV